MATHKLRAPDAGDGAGGHDFPGRGVARVHNVSEAGRDDCEERLVGRLVCWVLARRRRRRALRAAPRRKKKNSKATTAAPRLAKVAGLQSLPLWYCCRLT